MHLSNYSAIFRSTTNISNGLSAILICFEMVIFAVLHTYAFDYRVYRPEIRHKSTIWFAIVDSMNPIDFFRELWYGLVYIRYLFGGKLPKNLRGESEADYGTWDIETVMVKARPASFSGHRLSLSMRHSSGSDFDSYGARHMHQSTDPMQVIVEEKSPTTPP